MLNAGVCVSNSIGPTSDSNSRRNGNLYASAKLRTASVVAFLVGCQGSENAGLAVALLAGCHVRVSVDVSLALQALVALLLSHSLSYAPTLFLSSHLDSSYLPSAPSSLPSALLASNPSKANCESRVQIKIDKLSSESSTLDGSQKNTEKN